MILEEDCNWSLFMKLCFIIAEWQVNKSISQKKKTKLLFFHISLTFFSLLSVSWCLWEKEQKTEVYAYERKWQSKNRGHGCWVYVLGSERAGNWEHNPDDCQPFTHSHTTTQRQRAKTNTHFWKKRKEKKKQLKTKKQKTTQFKWKVLGLNNCYICVLIFYTNRKIKQWEKHLVQV